MNLSKCVLSSMASLSIFTVLSIQCIAGNLFQGDSSFETGPGAMVMGSSGASGQWSLDSKASAEGTRSLKLTCSAAGRTQSVPFPITAEQEGKTFTFSLYAKADRDGIPARLYMLQQNWTNGVYGQDVILTKEWKRHSITGQMKKGEYWLGIEAKKPGVIWTDAFQLEEGAKPSDYRNTPKACVGISVPAANDHVFFKGEAIPISIGAFDVTDGGNARLSVWITDCHGKTVMREEHEVFQKGGRFDMVYEFNPKELGWFNIHSELSRDGKL